MRRALVLAALALGAGYVYARSSVGSVDPFDGFDVRGLADASAPGSMRLSERGLDLLKRSEGFSATPYHDAGDFSIGYGHFGLDDLIFPGEAIPSITEAGAAQLLAADVAESESAVNRAVRVPLTQGQFDALVSFVYNVGETKFRGSTLLRRLNAGDYAAVPAELRKWRLSGGEVSQALVARREVEVAAWAGSYA